MPRPIGRILLTATERAQANRWSFWLDGSEPVDLYVGSLVRATGVGGQTLYGVVEQVEAATATSGAIDAWYAWSRGDAAADPPSQLPVIRIARVRVVATHGHGDQPPTGPWPIYALSPADGDALAADIPNGMRVPLGFVRVGDTRQPDGWMPLFGDAAYLLGPEGAHINVTGQSGMATKSSYLLFLAEMVWRWGRRAGTPPTVVLFNVKQRDFLGLHHAPTSQSDLLVALQEWSQTAGERLATESAAMWEILARFGYAPWDDPPPVRYFLPPDDPDTPRLLASQANVQTYRYGLSDLSPEALVDAVFELWADPSEVQPQADLLRSWRQQALDAQRAYSFADLQAQLRDAVRSSGGRRVGDMDETYHESTIHALRRRLRSLHQRVRRVVDWDRPHAQPVTWNRLLRGGWNVVQISGESTCRPLSPYEQRLVFAAVVSELLREPQADGTLARAVSGPPPEREPVIVVVDELNKFAPVRGPSGIRGSLIEIAARGRGLRLSLFSAEQFASQVHREVIGNGSTLAVGRTTASEIALDLYNDLGALRDQAVRLPKGSLIVQHGPFPAPLVIRFPVPPSRVVLPA